MTGINFTNAELLARVKAAAEAEGRSFSNYVCRILEQALKEPEGSFKEVNSGAGQAAADTAAKKIVYTIRKPRKPVA